MPTIPINNKCLELGCQNKKTYRSAFCSDHGGGKTVKGKTNGKLYNSKAWQIRRDMQLSMYPLCAKCLSEGKVTQANHVDHVFPHRQDSNKFFLNIYQSLCPSCHTLKTQEENKGNYYHYAKGLIYKDNDYHEIISNKLWE